MWDEASPDLGAILQANNLDTRDPRNWAQAWNAVRMRAAKIMGPRTVVPNMPQPPIGNATSQPAARNTGPKLTEAQRRNIDENAELAGIKKGSPTYQKLVKLAARDFEAGGYAHDDSD